MINSRSILDLDDDTRHKAMALQLACAEQGIDIIFTSTHRDHEAQDALYALGRTKPGKVVTKAKGGDSYHNWQCAFDVVPTVNGKAVWDDNDLWQRIGEIGVAVGLEWGGNWTKFKDRPHFQNTRGMTLAQFKAGVDVA